MVALAALALLAAAPSANGYRSRLPEDEVIYFLLPDRFENGDPSNDRGGISGDRLRTGYDPTSTGFYHGGDLKGVMKRPEAVTDEDMQLMAQKLVVEAKAGEK